jgi:hypothetical protein
MYIERRGHRRRRCRRRIEDTKIVVLGPEAGFVSYKAIYEDGAGEFAVMTTTIYKKSPDGWKGILYQQTRALMSR